MGSCYGVNNNRHNVKLLTDAGLPHECCFYPSGESSAGLRLRPKKALAERALSRIPRQLRAPPLIFINSGSMTW